MAEKLLRLRDLADIWSCSLSSIQRLRRAGVLNVVVVGKRAVRVRESEAQRAVEVGLTPKPDGNTVRFTKTVGLA